MAKKSCLSHIDYLSPIDDPNEDMHFPNPPDDLESLEDFWAGVIGRARENCDDPRILRLIDDVEFD